MAIRAYDLDKVWPLYGTRVFTQLGGIRPLQPVEAVETPEPVGVPEPTTSINAPGSATGMRFLTTQESIQLADGLTFGTDVTISVVTASQATGLITLSTRAAEPISPDAHIATFTLQSTLQPTVVTVGNCADCGEDAADHFYVVVGRRGEAGYQANETPIRLFGKTDDSNFITADTFAFMLIAF